MVFLQQLIVSRSSNCSGKVCRCLAQGNNGWVLERYDPLIDEDDDSDDSSFRSEGSSSTGTTKSRNGRWNDLAFKKNIIEYSNKGDLNLQYMNRY